MVAFGSILTIFAGVIIIAAAIVILVVIAKVKRALDPIATLVNTCDFEQQELEIQTTPKSVNAMTSVYLPRIERDFPEFSYSEFKVKAENMMKSAFNAISTEDITRLINASGDLTAQINNRIESNRLNHLDENYSDIKIHRTEIKNYSKTSGNCVITLQSSVGYIHSVTDSHGNIVKGDKDNMFQTRYDIDLMYVQDAEKIADGDTLLSNNCPNCGAPIKTLGVKTCPYCGSAVAEINVRTWSINRLTEC